MPFDDLSPEQDRAWIGQAFAETTAAHLGDAGRNVVSLTELERKLEEKGITAGASVTTATVIVIGRELGATRAVVGRTASVGQNLRLRPDTATRHAAGSRFLAQPKAQGSVQQDHPPPFRRSHFSGLDGLG